MESGFRYLLGIIVLIALAFSLISIWPVLTETKPRTTRVTSVISQATTPTLPLVPKLLPPAPAITQPVPSQPPAIIPQPASQFQNPEITLIPDWVYTRKRIKLLKEPGGDSHRSQSINQTELEIMPGTRLRSVRPEDGWLLVQSPSRLYGWVRETDVTKRAPSYEEPGWTLYPSN